MIEDVNFEVTEYAIVIMQCLCIGHSLDKNILYSYLALYLDAQSYTDKSLIRKWSSSQLCI